MDLVRRNRWAFSLGTVGRDMAYSLFTLFLMAFIMYTKSLTDAQYAAVGLIFVVCRVFDALIDPFIGGMVDSTRSRFGKFKPWIFAGMAGAAVDLVLLFSLPLYGWQFVGFLAGGYVLFSITYSLNDISYWGMLPALSSRPDERNRLVSLSNVCAGAGSGPIIGMVPLLTAGKYAIGGNALRAYLVIAVVTALCFVGFQSVTLLGVKEPRAALSDGPGEKLGFKETVRTVLRNDQLLWASVVLLMQGTLSGLGNAGLSMAYVYLVYGYNGLLMPLSLIGGISGLLVVIFLPHILARISRRRFLFLAAMSLVTGAAVMLLSGVLPNVSWLPKAPWLPSFIVYSLASLFTTAGAVAFYQTLFIDIANTVEYNELKTGRRSEGLIFAMRPLMSQMASAVVQLVIMVIFLALGITHVNRGISELENAVDRQLISPEEKLAGIQAILSAVPKGKALALLLCLALLPTLIGLCGYWIYRKKFKLDERAYEDILSALEAKKAQEG